MLRAIADGHNTVAAIRALFDVAKPRVVTRLCLRLRHRGLVVLTAVEGKSKAPGVWQLTRNGSIVISAMKNPAPRRSARRARPVDDAAHNGRAQLLSDGEIYAMGRWTGDAWVSAPGAEPLDMTPTEVLL